MKSLAFAITLAAFVGSEMANAQDANYGPDTEVFADLYDISLDEAERRIRLQTKVSNLEAELTENPKFGGLKIIQNRNNFRVLLRFKGRSPEIAEISSDPELQALLDVNGARRSRGEFIALQNRVAAAARARKIETMLFPDVVTEKVEVHVRDVEAFRSALSDLNIGSDDVILVQADHFPEPQQGTVIVEGGLRLAASLGGNCTVGFAATRGTDKGLLTAGHCAIRDKGGLASSTVTVSLSGVTFVHGTSHWSDSSDLAFFKNANATLSARVTNRDMRRMSTGLAANGATMCKYGAISGYGCYPVYSNWATTTDSAGNTTGPMSVLECAACTSTNQISEKGDSGGPIFINYDGYGVHHGGSPQFLWYTPVYRASAMSIVPIVAP